MCDVAERLEKWELQKELRSEDWKEKKREK